MNLENIRVILIFLLITLVLLACTGCTGQPEEPSHGTIRVAVTIPPQAEFVEHVGGDNVQVLILVPPGADPHTYEPTPGALSALSTADMYAMVGSGIEFELAWMDKITAINPRMLIVNCAEGVSLLAAGDGLQPDHARPDPHIWLSPGNARIMVGHIYDGLVEIDPDNEEVYRQNRDEYLGELEELDLEMRHSLALGNVSAVMVFHPAWTYLAHEYGFLQIAIEEAGKEPTPRDLEEMIQKGRQHNIRVIITEPEFSTRTAEIIAREIGGKVVLASPLKKEYLDNMRNVSVAFSGGSPA